MNREELNREYDALLAKLASPSITPDERANAARRLKELQTELARLQQEEVREKRRREAEAVLRNETDAELRILAEEELRKLDEEERAEDREATEGRPERNGGANAPAGERETAIVEIRPGTGGKEAALFAADLGRMYLRFAERRSWKMNVLDETSGELGGVKSLVLSIKGSGAYRLLRTEAGVHRVQRIPETEKSGRIHTSTATVAVLPKAAARDVQIPISELRIDTMRASGPGGQFVNRRESAVRILHIPTGTIVVSQTARNQKANREQAMEILLAKLAARKHAEEEAKTGAARNAQIGTGERSEKIRTYNFPQDRVTDHRIGKSWHHIQGILDGNLDNLIESVANASP